MDARYFLVISSYILILLTDTIPIRAYTLTPSDTMTDGQTLTSQGGMFKLGFFTPSPHSKKRYLGIWFNTLPVQTVVWVANRDSPLWGTSGVLKIGSTGNLNLVMMFNQTENIIWSTNTSEQVKYPIVEFLESGNLVLRDSKNPDSKRFLWQSFDYITNTLLPGMKFGLNRRTGINRYMSSWKNLDDPLHGDYTWGLELDGYPEFIMRKGSKKYYRDGPWNLTRNTAPVLLPNQHFTYYFIENAEEMYFMFERANNSVIGMILLMQTNTEGFVRHLTWIDKTNSWAHRHSLPRDYCDTYKICGAYSTCDIGDMELCQCLEGFKPKSPEAWSLLDRSMGCERQVPINCSHQQGFKRFSGITLPDTESSWVNMSLNRVECRAACLTNCSCMAYSNLNIKEDGSGCILWFTDLIDMRLLNNVRQDFYIRIATSQPNLDSQALAPFEITVIVSFTSISCFLALGFGVWCYRKKSRKEGGIEKDNIELLQHRKRDDHELPLFDLITIIIATNNFSEENKLGQGGFGSVYKGMLDGEEIAVKRLSKNSVQGVTEFTNEVLLISKLQHRNLVRILGYCTEGEEMILIYEYMQNNSLDSFMFDGTKNQVLDWEKRAQIIAGIARGLLYLHQDSRLKIIHRDLKTSNILLDNELLPKISDFGLARIFGGEQMEAITRRVVGTRGYMSPEYALEGNFSDKSDVFSFGVLVLEVISGKRNRGFIHPEHDHNLVGHAWRLWNQNKYMELVDTSIDKSCFVRDIRRCIHIALLCLQIQPTQRPSMKAVDSMLSNESIVLSLPQTPDLYKENTGIYIEENFPYSDRETTITLLEAR
ncbi:hypothetical protein ACHQM5_014386 [Ranunculus cassubicifolius]